MANDVTQLLAQWRGGDEAALEQLLPLVYGELRQMARTYLRGERPDHSLQATALVHEAYLKLVDQKDMQWNNRAHFFGLASRMIRNILVDHARSRARLKRGGGGQKITLKDALAMPEAKDVDLVRLNDALEQLAKLDPQQGRIVELRFFGGLTIEETAEVLQVSVSTVKRDWLTAKMWLYRELATG